eukprot:CAMPEP_0119551606 /NCGR_PEP_ID=MMETSP1352-20130426/4811_1 /TAXON_ID=265584 /ORGANISM="Stauroneis constricta, Strain CCMP1120" /LENGTH=743 /DNA_ID=CAMNT_0007597691 /DNA_START=81 /DNA_END=2312 /DNA_ORIENTATION=-
MPLAQNPSIMCQDQQHGRQPQQRRTTNDDDDDDDDDAFRDEEGDADDRFHDANSAAAATDEEEYDQFDDAGGHGSALHQQLTTPPSSPLPPIQSMNSKTAASLPPISPLTPMDRGNGGITTSANGRTLLYATNQPKRQQRGRRTQTQPLRSSSSSSLCAEGGVTSCSSPRGTEAVHETIHAQSLLLGVAFMAIWSANNLMAPNLTQMANFFGMDESQRDLYLGSYGALAVGVFSLPISALIGIMTDFMPRKYLFVATAAGGALSSAATGMSPNFTWLFLARLVNGGCMSGSVPVAFSLLGDLFVAEERNAASSGLTAMMGSGIILGQVYAGVVGSSAGWSHPFYVSAMISAVAAVFVLLWVREPVRGGKERVLQDMIRSGTKYDRHLTWDGFVHTIKHNQSNRLLIWQGFFSSVPWGIIFVFLNDFLSQEKGFSVPDATFMVMLFGIGCAVGGVLGGYLGQVFMGINRSYLPLFMAASTFVGFFPFYGLLNSDFPNPRGYLAMFYSASGGIIASLPSVNVRPCILNVNPPETRGATLTAANLIIMLARGVGPSCITLMGSLLNVNRQFSFNVTLFGFWLMSSIQLVLLSRTLPGDQDQMETELARYAEEAVQLAQQQQQKQQEQLQQYDQNDHNNNDDTSSMVSIEERILSFDGNAARQSLKFMRMGIKEISDEVVHLRHFDKCGNNNDHHPSLIQNDDDSDDDIPTNYGSTNDIIMVPSLNDDHNQEHRRKLFSLQEENSLV